MGKKGKIMCQLFSGGYIIPVWLNDKTKIEPQCLLARVYQYL
jgi:hypothetical protein